MDAKFNDARNAPPNSMAALPEDELLELGKQRERLKASNSAPLPSPARPLARLPPLARAASAPQCPLSATSSEPPPRGACIFKACGGAPRRPCACWGPA